MKENELMIGDWLHLHYCNKFEGEVHKNFRVGQIRNDYGEMCVWAIKDGGGIYGNMGELEPRYGETHISPIPLTPEILGKNGFVKYDMNSAEDYLDVPDLSPCFAYGYFPNGIENGWVINIINDYLVVSCRGCSIHKKIHYVHELQHALRLCGISKEIIL